MQDDFPLPAKLKITAWGKQGEKKSLDKWRIRKINKQTQSLVIRKVQPSYNRYCMIKA